MKAPRLFFFEKDNQMKKSFLSLILILAAAISLSGNIVYVTPDGSGDGSSWENATGDLQAAINMYDSAQVWVAAGTYIPQTFPPNIHEDDSTDVRCYAFYLQENVDIYGGFAGNETELSQRDWNANETILSGDLGQAYSNSDNAYNVICNWHPSNSPMDTAAVLDGFTVRDAKADGEAGTVRVDHNYGAGMSNIYAYVIVRNCNFINNTAGEYYGSPSAQGHGGAISNRATTAIIENCHFENNSAKDAGGAIYNSVSNVTISDCKFISNTSHIYGGGAINNHIFSSATTTYTVKIERSLFDGNDGQEGGAVYNGDYSKLNFIIVNSVFKNNEATNRGGAIFCINSTDQSYIVNNTFSGNKAEDGGAAVMSAGTLTNPVIANNIMWGNTKTSTGDAADFGGYGDKRYYNLIGNLTASGTNINEDPIFADDDLRIDFGSPCIDAAKDFYLTYYFQTDSVDFDGFDRFVGEAHDMGAYEKAPMQASPEGILYLKAEAPSYGTGESWDKAATNLTEAIKFMESGEIWLAKGTYYPTENFNGAYRYSQGGTWITPDSSWSWHFQLKNNVAIRGGFTGDEAPDFDINERDFEANETIISGNVGSQSDETDNSRFIFRLHEINLNATAILDGFTIRDGYSEQSGGVAMTIYGNYYGNNTKPSPTIMNCNFTNNKALTSLGGFITIVTVAYSQAKFINCSFTNNEVTASYEGNAFVVSISTNENNPISPSFTGCTIKDNSANGLRIGYSKPVIELCVIENNSGYGIMSEGFRYSDSDRYFTEPKLNRCIIRNNGNIGFYARNESKPRIVNTAFIANGKGGFDSVFDYNIAQLVNCTFYKNMKNDSDWDRGAGVNSPKGTTTITNCIFSENVSGSYVPEQIETNDSSLVTYTLIQGGDTEYWLGDGVIFDEPQFKNTNSWELDLRLQESSPAVDAGNDEAYNAVCSDTLELNNTPRFVGDAIDMGAYEFTTISSIDEENLPTSFALDAAYPNPFNPQVSIPFSVKELSQVNLTVYNMLGQKVAILSNGVIQAGTYTYTWTPENLSSGVYLIQMTAINGNSIFNDMQKVVYLK
jgi:hypothetical protein